MTQHFDWTELAFGSKKSLRQLDAVFIAAPREISVKRFKQLIKHYLPQANLVLGIAREAYVEGHDGQPQFKMLALQSVSQLIDTVNNQPGLKHRISVLTYAQTDLVYLLEKINFQRVILVNGSWHGSFHTRPAYYALARKLIPLEMVSPFSDEAEARHYAATAMPLVTAATPLPIASQEFTATDMLAAARMVAKRSFDYGFQTGAVFGKKTSNGYIFLTSGYNKVVPYQTYAMHYGAARERHLSQTNDLNHYDTVHAEVELILQAARQGVELTGTTLFINLLPCPTCSRMLADTPIAEVVYQIDHSGGYAIAMLEAAGKTVTRVVDSV